jgi:hypothetical protein
MASVSSTWKPGKKLNEMLEDIKRKRVSDFTKATADRASKPVYKDNGAVRSNGAAILKVNSTHDQASGYKRKASSNETIKKKKAARVSTSSLEKRIRDHRF